MGIHSRTMCCGARDSVVSWLVQEGGGYYFAEVVSQHLLGTVSGGKINFTDVFGGGHLPYDLVADAAANLRDRHPNGIDWLAGEDQRRQIRGMLVKLHHGEELDVGEPTSLLGAYAGGALQGAKAGALNFADDLTLNMSDWIGEARAQAWADAGDLPGKT